MVPSISIFLLAVFIAMYELPSLLQQESRKDLAVFVIFLAAGMTLSILQVLRISIPNPIVVITFIFEPLAHVIDRVLGIRR
ncbi:hypothetical protein OH784_22800 [Ectobacillus funiculus]|uniref:hypothetical protein n=1 Tax=Ectobacillus funiculus TaxID=137993 RepID=UPI00397B84D2